LPTAASSETNSGDLLQASTAPDFTGLIASSRTFAVLESTLTVSSLDPDTTYYFRAASLNRHRVTGYFTVLGATSTVANAPGALAQSGTFLEVHETSMTAAWVAHPLSPPAQTCQGYRLEASSTGFNGAGVVISSDTPNVGLSTLTVLAPALWANTTYYLRVAAFNHNGVLSEFTALASTATLAPSPSAKKRVLTKISDFWCDRTRASMAPRRADVSGESPGTEAPFLGRTASRSSDRKCEQSTTSALLLKKAATSAGAETVALRPMTEKGVRRRRRSKASERETPRLEYTSSCTSSAPILA